MVKLSFTATTLMAAALLSGCVEGVTPYTQSPDTIIAIPQDRGRDKTGIADAKAAIAYDPDGCQGWIMDDGVEGYSGRRFDPVSGLPVCNNLYPPGTVLKNYQTSSPGIRDYVPYAARVTR
jgi:hypothetical protein